MYAETRLQVAPQVPLLERHLLIDGSHGPQCPPGEAFFTFIPFNVEAPSCQTAVLIGWNLAIQINDLPRVATISPLCKIPVRLSPAHLNSNQCIPVYLTDSYQLADELTAHAIKYARRRTAPTH